MNEGYTIVTGASSGIGLEMAHELAKTGRPLVLVARSEAALNQLAQEWREKYKIEILVVAADLGTPAGIQKTLTVVAEVPLRALINNAGFGELGRFWEAKWSVIEQMIALNITGLVHLTHALVPRFVKQGHGEILNVASVAGFQPGPYFNVYSATKAFVVSFSEALHEELRSTGVSVTVLCPGVTATNFHVRAGTLELPPPLNGKASANSVARFGLKAMAKGWRVAVPGLLNRGMAVAARHLPKSTVVRLAGVVLKPR